MSIYAYPQSRVVDEVTFRKTANGALRAYVHACPEIAAGKIDEVLSAFKAANFECIPFTLHNKPVVEVRGFKRNSELVTLLADHQYIDHKPVITKEPEDHQTWGDILRKRSIQASGAAFMVADTGFTIYGAKSKHWEDTAAGLAYFTGSAMFTAFGRNDQSSFQIREGAQAILEHAKQQGYKVDEDSALACMGTPKKQTVFRRVHEFFQKHPSEIGNMMYVAAGALIATSALRHRALAEPRPDMEAKQIAEMRRGGWGDVALGSTTIASGLTATLVTEKARDPDSPRKHGLAGIVEWIREKPLRAASYGYIGSTLFHSYTTFIERKEAHRMLKNTAASLSEVAHAKDQLKAIPWRVLFVSATLVGELLLSISSKGHGEGVLSDNTVDDSIVNIAAELIIKQPKHMQDALITEMGTFLGKPEVLALKDQEAIDRLREQVEVMRSNPWATKIPAAKNPESTEAPARPAGAPAPAPAAGKEIMPAWQAKVVASEKIAAAPRPNL